MGVVARDGGRVVLRELHRLAALGHGVLAEPVEVEELRDGHLLGHGDPHPLVGLEVGDVLPVVRELDARRGEVDRGGQGKRLAGREDGDHGGADLRLAEELADRARHLHEVAHGDVHVGAGAVEDVDPLGGQRVPVRVRILLLHEEAADEVGVVAPLEVGGDDRADGHGLPEQGRQVVRSDDRSRRGARGALDRADERDLRGRRGRRVGGPGGREERLERAGAVGQALERIGVLVRAARLVELHRLPERGEQLRVVRVGRAVDHRVDQALRGGRVRRGPLVERDRVGAVLEPVGRERREVHVRDVRRADHEVAVRVRRQTVEGDRPVGRVAVAVEEDEAQPVERGAPRAAVVELHELGRVRAGGVGVDLVDDEGGSGRRAGRVGAEREGHPRRGVGRRPVERVRAGERPLRDVEHRAWRRAGQARGPAVEVLPRPAGAVHVGLPERVDHHPVLEELDRVVAVDAGRRAGEVRLDPEERRHPVVAVLRGDVEELPRRGAAREGQLLPVGAAAVVGRAEPVDREVGDLCGRVELDDLGQAARERTVDDAGDDE